MPVFADEGDPEDSDVAPKVRRAVLAKLLAPIGLVLGDGTARLLMTPAAVPTRCSSLSMSRPTKDP